MAENTKQEYKITEEEEKIIDAFRDALENADNVILDIVCKRGKVYSIEHRIIKYY